MASENFSVAFIAHIPEVSTQAPIKATMTIGKTVFFHQKLTMPEGWHTVTPAITSSAKFTSIRAFAPRPDIQNDTLTEHRVQHRLAQAETGTVV